MSTYDDGPGCLGYSIILALFLVAALLYSAFFGSMVSDDEATNALSDAGFTNITITDRDPYFVDFKGCGQDDEMMFKATATNSAGKVVHVTVCTGFFLKNTTIRYNH